MAGDDAVLERRLSQQVVDMRMQRPERQITAGQIYPISRAAIANDDHDCFAMPQRRPGEILRGLLVRLEAAVAKALTEHALVGENNPPLPSRRY